MPASDIEPGPQPEAAALTNEKLTSALSRPDLNIHTIKQSNVTVKIHTKVTRFHG